MSSHYNREDCIWKKYVLYFNSKKTLEIVKDVEVPSMYRILWINGTLSEDYYNLARAKENAIKHTLRANTPIP